MIGGYYLGIVKQLKYPGSMLDLSSAWSNKGDVICEKNGR